MGGSQKSKRVTWASDVNLCQVKLFLSEESPSRVRLGTQDHLQAKALLSVPSGCICPDDNLPPGFEGIQPANLWRVKLSQIPLTKWRCPPRFEVNNEWLVVAGEESEELEAQNQREMRVFEAIYPRPSAIPPNPSALAAVEDTIISDQDTPLVPVTPIEDDDTALDPSFGSMTANNIPMISQPQQLPHGTLSSHANGISATVMEPDIIAAAQAALTSVISNSGPGSLIDRNLLMKILSDPKMVEQIVAAHSASSSVQNRPSSSRQNTPSSSFESMPAVGVQTVTSSNTHVPSSRVHNTLPASLQSMPAIGVQNMPSTNTQYMPNLRSPPKNLLDPINRRDPLSTHVARPELMASSMATAAGSFYPPQLRTGSIPNFRPSLPNSTSGPSPSVGTPMTKDINYYKSLIQQHGGERRETLAHRSNQPMGASPEPLNFMKSREPKPKIMKPCLYFNSPKGCRNGANCAFQHEMSSQQRVSGIPEVQSTKRVKLDRGITGT